MQQQQGMATGTVKWFNMARGFGFIVEDGGAEREGERLSFFFQLKSSDSQFILHKKIQCLFIRRLFRQRDSDILRMVKRLNSRLTKVIKDLRRSM